MDLDKKNELFERITNFIKNSDDISHNILLMRLFEEYENRNNKIAKNEISLIDLKKAHTNINKKVNYIDKEENEYYTNLNLLNTIKRNVIMLNACLTNFDTDDRDNINLALDLITKLECLLKIPISFPDNIEPCLQKSLDEKNYRSR